MSFKLITGCVVLLCFYFAGTTFRIVSDWAKIFSTAHTINHCKFVSCGGPFHISVVFFGVSIGVLSLGQAQQPGAAARAFSDARAWSAQGFCTLAGGAVDGVGWFCELWFNL